MGSCVIRSKNQLFSRTFETSYDGTIDALISLHPFNLPFHRISKRQTHSRTSYEYSSSDFKHNRKNDLLLKTLDFFLYSMLKVSMTIYCRHYLKTINGSYIPHYKYDMEGGGGNVQKANPEHYQ